MNLFIPNYTSPCDLDYILQPFLLDNGTVHPLLHVEFEENTNKEVIKEFARIKCINTRKKRS
jgi:hypothetical protein